VVGTHCVHPEHHLLLVLNKGVAAMRGETGVCGEVLFTTVPFVKIFIAVRNFYSFDFSQSMYIGKYGTVQNMVPFGKS